MLIAEKGPMLQMCWRSMWKRSEEDEETVRKRRPQNLLICFLKEGKPTQLNFVMS
jgi:hypothetical protein